MKKYWFAASLACVSTVSPAATYYVDADAGRDTYSGLSASLTGGTSTGPWQTIAKVNAAALLPGDQVLFKCGQSWRETLRVMKSGTSSQPIYYGSYPGGCAQRPAIDGAFAVGADNWQRVSGSVYQASLPLSVLSNGRLDASVAGWRFYSPKADARLAFAASCPDMSAGCGQVTTATDSALAISPAFTVRNGERYTVKFEIYAPAGMRYGAIVRRFSNTATTLTPFMAGSGSGGWQSVSFPFTASDLYADARLDIQTGGSASTTYLRNVRIEAESTITTAPLMATAPDGPLDAAHHPNKGFNASAPTSMYLSAGLADYIRGSDGRYGSTYITTGSDLVLPAGAAITAGMKAFVRSQAWSVKEHTVTAVSGNRVSISPQTAYPLRYAGWGYYFTGAAWMVDAPREFNFDAATSTARVYMPDGAAPGDRVKIGFIQRGIDIGAPNSGIFPSYVTFENLAVRNVQQGVVLSRASNVSLRNMEIRDIGGFGVSAEGAASVRIESSTIANTQSDAIFGYGASGATVANNEITNSGVLYDPATKQINSSPRENFSAVMVGANSTVSGNRIVNAGYIGLQAGSNSTISGNLLNHYSLVLNDAGGVYGAGAKNVRVTDNMILDGVGNRDGLPSVIQTLVGGVYLDGNADGFVLQRNTFGEADYCMQMHDAYNNTFEDNTCYGARRSTLRLQETSKAVSATGDTFNNTVRYNRFFQTATGSTVVHTSTVTDVSDFATYDWNAYSTMVTPLAAAESSPTGARSYTLPEWRQAVSSAGSARALEPNGSATAPVSRYARGSFGANLVPGLLQTGGGWSRAGSTSTTAILPGCGPAATPCLTLVAGTSSAGLSSPRFAIAKGQWYRVSFDAAVSDPTQAVRVMVMRSGPTYESLMGLEPFTYTAGNAWKRYSFYFKATADAAVTSTTPGARLDVMDVKAGGTVSIANLEVAPMSTSFGESTSALLSNTERTDKLVDCPVAATAPAACSKFLSFPDGAAVSFPVRLAAFKSQVVFTQDNSLPDADGDGIGDAQDRCPATPRGADTNLQGCALGE